jgi:hypothetical protein
MAIPATYEFLTTKTDRNYHLFLTKLNAETQQDFTTTSKCLLRLHRLLFLGFSNSESHFIITYTLAENLLITPRTCAHMALVLLFHPTQ